jgi:hypothetical protein
VSEIAKCNAVLPFVDAKLMLLVNAHTYIGNRLGLYAKGLVNELQRCTYTTFCFIVVLLICCISDVHLQGSFIYQTQYYAKLYSTSSYFMGLKNS